MKITHYVSAAPYTCAQQIKKTLIFSFQSVCREDVSVCEPGELSRGLVRGELHLHPSHRRVLQHRVQPHLPGHAALPHVPAQALLRLHGARHTPNMVRYLFYSLSFAPLKNYFVQTKLRK